MTRVGPSPHVVYAMRTSSLAKANWIAGVSIRRVCHWAAIDSSPISPSTIDWLGVARETRTMNALHETAQLTGWWSAAICPQIDE